MFEVGIALFTLASLACGLAPTADALIAARVVQGAAAALAFPQVLSILNVTYTGRTRATAFTAFGVMLGLASIAGQLVGGLLIAADVAGSSWRACFLINVPIGVVVLLLCRAHIAESRAERAERLDGVGVLLSASGLTLLVFPLVAGRQSGWPTWSYLMLALAPLVLAAFVAHQRARIRRDRSPLLALILFRERKFVAGLVIVLSFYASTQSLLLVIALFLQDGRGLTPLQAGATFLPLGVGYMMTSMAAARLRQWLGHQALALGALLMAASYAIMWVTVPAGHGSALRLVPGLTVNGLGMGMVMGPLIATVLARVRSEHAGSAAGILTTVQQVAGALGVALIGLIFYGTLGAHPGPLTYQNAFRWSLLCTSALVVCVAALVQTLNERAGSRPPGERSCAPAA